MRQTAEQFLGDSLWVQLSAQGQMLFSDLLSTCRTYNDRIGAILGACMQSDYGMANPSCPTKAETEKFNAWKQLWCVDSFSSFTFNWMMQPHPVEWPSEHTKPEVYTVKVYDKQQGNYLVIGCKIPKVFKKRTKEGEVHSYLLYDSAPVCILLAYSTLVLPVISGPDDKRALAQGLLDKLVEVYDKRSEQCVGRESHVEATYRHIKVLIDELKR